MGAIILSCNEEELTDWASLVPGHYLGEMYISSEPETTYNNVGKPFIHFTKHETFSTEAEITSSDYGFDVVFKDYGIVDQKDVGIYIIEITKYGATIGIGRTSGNTNAPKSLLSGFYSAIDGPGGEIIPTDDNGCHIHIRYARYYETDSALLISYIGTKSFP